MKFHDGRLILKTSIGQNWTKSFSAIYANISLVKVSVLEKDDFPEFPYNMNFEKQILIVLEYYIFSFP